jgi:hypothetical protein
MFGSQILDVLIGLASVFLLLSLVATAVREAVEAVLKTRAVMLERGLRELLGDPTSTGMVARFYGHPLIFSLYRRDFKPMPGWRLLGRNLPTYIPSRNFSGALMDLAFRGQRPGPYAAFHTAPVLTVETLRRGVARLPNAQLRHAFLAAIDDARGDLNAVRSNLEAWFDSSMDRVSGWYKRQTQLWLLLIGALLAGGLNVNTIEIAQHLWKDKTAREALVSRADLLQNDPSYRRASSDSSGVAALAVPPSRTLASLDLPIGWDHLPARDAAQTGRVNYLLRLIAGILITTLAVTLGAPFWFDALNRIMVIRSTVKPHEKSPEEASEDRSEGPGRGIHVTVNGAPDANRVQEKGAALAEPAAAPDDRRLDLLTIAPSFTPRVWATGDPEEGIL